MGGKYNIKKVIVSFPHTLLRFSLQLKQETVQLFVLYRPNHSREPANSPREMQWEVVKDQDTITNS